MLKGTLVCQLTSQMLVLLLDIKLVSKLESLGIVGVVVVTG